MATVKKTNVKPASVKKTSAKKASSENCMMSSSWMPNYEAMTPALAIEAFEASLPKAEQAFRNVEKQLEISWRGLVVAPFLAVRAPFELWSMLSHLTSVVNSEAWRAVEQTYQPRIIALSQCVSQSKALYEGMLSLAEDSTLPSWQQHVVSGTLLAMRNAGVGLVGTEKRKLNALQTELAKQTLLFSNHVLDAEKAAKVEIAVGEEAGIKPDLLEGKGPWTLGIDFATYDSVMRYAENRDVRERFWRARATRASSGKLNNAPLIERILKLRQQEATLLGYRDFAHLSTSVKMAGTPLAVEQLLAPMLSVGKPAARAEDKALAAFARKQGLREPLQPWDKPYWIERLSQEQFGFDEEALRDYFPMERVLTGLFELIHRLLGVTFERSTGALHAWHKEVRFYSVLNEKGVRIAGFYFDPYVRPGTKNGGAWVNEIRARDFETRQQLPIAVICCNQKAPRGKSPATMSVYEVSTLFHEMGHALQQMLTTVDSPTCSGLNNIEWDAVEIASQFLEQFPHDVKILRSLSCHIKTAEKLPLALAQAIAAKRTYRAGNALVRQLLFAQLDLFLHSYRYRQKFRTADECKTAFSRRFLPEAMHQDDRFLNAFTHIFAGGYAAGYFSYKWSETLSADIYAAFDGQPAATVKKMGRKARTTLFALGGSQPAATVFQSLMGRDPDPSAILRAEGLLTP
ncbi:MAG: M3 family metallopeptidase [Kiritimatiellia bacterium]